MWNETLKVRAADDIDNPELHIVLYDYDAAIPGNILSVEDDFLGEIRIPLPKDGGDEFIDVVDAPLVGQLAQIEGSTISLSWRRDTLHDLKKSKKTQKNLVDYMISATTWSDSYISAQTSQPIYAMVVGNQGSTPLVCLQDESEQVMFTDTDSHYELCHEDLAEPPHQWSRGENS